MSKKLVEVSASDQAKLAILRTVIEESYEKVAAILGPYMGIKQPRAGQLLPQAVIAKHAAPLAPRECGYVVFGEDGSCGCYRDPPGVCEGC